MDPPDATLESGPLTPPSVLGPGNGRDHAFGVMKALEQRFGATGVRLMVWFE